MARQDEPRLRLKDKIERIEEDSDVSRQETDRIKKVIASRDENDVRSRTNDANTLSPRTLAAYAAKLRLAAKEMGDLTDQNDDSINTFIKSLFTGESSIGPDDGYAKSTIGQYESAFKIYYQKFNSCDVNPDKIPIHAQDTSKVDERDIFTKEEIKSMRDAIDNPRNRCLFELLAYTGQRIRAIQTLRIKDIDLDNEIMYLNEQDGGLKNAEGKRPLLGAASYVRRWLDYHPTGEPDDYLITGSGVGGSTLGDKLGQNTINSVLKKIAKKANVDKDIHAHIFRHYFTTIAKRDYGLDDAYIKELRGDDPSSDVMSRVYRHLTDQDIIDYTQAKFAGKEPETQSPLSPESCPTCGEILTEGAKACPKCGQVFTPDAKGAEEQIDESVKQEYRDTDPTDGETMDKIDKLDELLDDPEIKAALLEQED